MVTRVYGTAEVEIDAEGFLVERDAWTPDIGEAIAHELGFALGPLHWRVINFAREEHASRGRRPTLPQIAASTGVPLRTLHALFPHATSAIISRIAGIPRPHAADRRTPAQRTPSQTKRPASSPSCSIRSNSNTPSYGAR